MSSRRWRRVRSLPGRHRRRDPALGGLSFRQCSLQLIIIDPNALRRAPDVRVRQADQVEQGLIEPRGYPFDRPQRRVSLAAHEVEVRPPADADLLDEALDIGALSLELLEADGEDLRQDRVLALAGFSPVTHGRTALRTRDRRSSAVCRR